MDMESVALMATLSQVMHQLTHFSESTKSPALKLVVNPLITAIRGAIAALASDD